MLDTAGRGDAAHWEELISRAPAFPPPYRAAPGNTVYHVLVDDHVLLVAEPDLTGPLRALVLAVLASGEPYRDPHLAPAGFPGRW